MNDDDAQHQYLEFNIKTLRLLNLWPEEGELDELKWKRWKTYTIFIASIPSSIPLVLECFLVFREDDLDIVVRVQSVLATVCVCGMFYMAVCFIQNSGKITEIVDRIKTFRRYTDLDMIQIDKKATLYSKIFFAYSCIGMLIYTSMPLLSLDYCEEHKSSSMEEYGIPCGIITRYRLPFRYDSSPMYEIFALHQMFLAGTTTIIIITITMTICGLLIHAVNQLKALRIKLLDLENSTDVEESLRFAIEYHIEIISYIDSINEAFGTQMILHMTLTSMVISVLGFEILMVDNFTESLRFGMHMAGWFVLFFLLCHYGQLLIDESVGVAHDAYATPWYETPVKVQKDIRLIIMRAQKPLTLKAINLGILSAGTYLRVISSSYSYFTLLVNLKK